jgi:ribosome biogenesis protein NSA1
MSRFLLGDQLGSIKVLRYSPQENSIDVKTVYHQEITPASSVERLAINSSSSNDRITVCTRAAQFLESWN